MGQVGALDVEVKLASGTVKGEFSSFVAARVADERATFIPGFGYKGERVLGVSSVVFLEWELRGVWILSLSFLCLHRA